jgi:hypothetical protein
MIDPTWVTAIATIIYTVGTFLLWWTTKNTLRTMDNSFKLSFLQIFERIGKEIIQDDVPTPIKKLQQARMNKAYIDLVQRVFPKEYEAIFPATTPPKEPNNP